MKRWRERDGGGDIEGGKLHWLTLPDPQDDEHHSAREDRNDLNSVDFPQSLNSTAWVNVISQTLSVVLDYLQLGRCDFRNCIFFPF